MRIISKVKDYYDGGMAMGQDTSVAYVRHATYLMAVPDRHGGVHAKQPKDGDGAHQRLSKADWAEAMVPIRAAQNTSGPRMLRFKPAIRGWWGRRDLGTGCVFFCGKSYPFYVTERVEKRDSFMGDVNISVFSWEKDFDLYCDQADVKREGGYREWLEANSGRDNPGPNLHYRSPIVIDMPGGFLPANKWYGTLDRHIGIDVPLAPLGFQRVIEPFTAFQEISMFVGGVLTDNRDPPAPVTDKQNVLRHGFDPIYGFRKTPESKKT
jgi:hypothetical protein